MIEKLQPASFRGVPFLVDTETKSGGKKTVTHEFVNSNKRFTEELGELPPNFSIEAIIHGENSIQERRDLERVLNLSGKGDLVHPVYGLVQQVKSTTYSVTSNQRNIGEFRFSVEFESSEDNVTAQPAPVTKSAVSKKAEDARAAIDNSIGAKYIDPVIPDTLTSASDKLKEIYNGLSTTISNNVGLVQEGIADFTRVVDDELAKVLTTAQQGADVKESLQGVYSAAISVTNQPEVLFDSWKDAITFGFDDLGGAVNTVFRLNKENNKSIMNEHTRISSMVNLYESAVYREFETDQELQDIEELLDDTYQRIMKDYDQDIDTGSVLVLAEDPDVRKTIAELRTITRQVLSSKEQAVFRVVAIDNGFTSMALTSYQYYGNIDNIDLLKALNTSVNLANFDEQIQAISE